MSVQWAEYFWTPEDVQAEETTQHDALEVVFGWGFLLGCLIGTVIGFAIGRMA
jgi:hypothetical protein